MDPNTTTEKAALDKVSSLILRTLPHDTVKNNGAVSGETKNDVDCDGHIRQDCDYPGSFLNKYFTVKQRKDLNMKSPATAVIFGIVLIERRSTDVDRHGRLAAVKQQNGGTRQDRALSAQLQLYSREINRWKSL